MQSAVLTLTAAFAWCQIPVYGDKWEILKERTLLILERWLEVTVAFCFCKEPELGSQHKCQVTHNWA